MKNKIINIPTSTFLVLVGIFIFFSCKTKKEISSDTKKNDIDANFTVNSIQKKPNVLIIFPDQLRRYSAGFWSKEPYKSLAYGKPDPVITPNIDKLAENGVVFTNAISNFPLCSPYRGMLISGVYPEQNGIWNNCKVERDDSLKDDIPTITSLFKEANYNTAYVGKVHWLENTPVFDKQGNYKGTTKPPGGEYLNKYDTYIPPNNRHGIEYFYQCVKDSHFNPFVFSNDPYTIDGKKDGEVHLPKKYTPKSESDVIVDYLKNNRNQRDANKPFLVMWSLNPPHNPWGDQYTDMTMVNKYYNKNIYPNIDEKLVVRNNVDIEKAQHARNYFGAVTSVDFYIGKVIAQLKAMGELDNTIIIFSSDHGEMLGSHGKQGKNQMELESLAIPFIVHWPKKLTPNTTDLLISVPDVLPTLMGLSGLGNSIPKSIQGKDYSSFLKGEKSNVKKPKASLLMLGNSRGVLTNRYTLVINDKKGKKSLDTSESSYLYDNIQDPYQLNKIALDELSSVSKDLLNELASLLKETNDPWYQKRKLSTIIPY